MSFHSSLSLFRFFLYIPYCLCHYPFILFSLCYFRSLITIYYLLFLFDFFSGISSIITLCPKLFVLLFPDLSFLIYNFFVLLHSLSYTHISSRPIFDISSHAEPSFFFVFLIVCCLSLTAVFFSSFHIYHSFLMSHLCHAFLLLSLYHPTNFPFSHLFFLF